MAERTLEDATIRARDVGGLGKILAALLAGALTAGSLVASMAAWKGGTDEQIHELDKRIDSIDQQLDRQDQKLDRLTEAIESRKQ